MQAALTALDYQHERCPIAQGIQVFEIFPSIYSGMLSVCPKEDITIVETPTEELWSLVFVLEGEAELTSFTNDKPVAINITPNTFTLFHIDKWNGSFSPMKKTQASMLSIRLNRQHLKYFLGVDDEINLDNIMCIHESVALNVTQKSILHRMFNSTKHGMVRSLYLQGNAAELLSDFLEPMIAQVHGSCCKKGEYCLSVEEIKGIKSARHILENNMINPPCLSELSRLVGLNINKLKRGFHAIYNTTPYAFLREARMIKSGNLLAKRGMNVSQVAWEVGYTNLGHFSAAFLMHYGVNPKAFQMSKNKKNIAQLKIVN